MIRSDLGGFRLTHLQPHLFSFFMLPKLRLPRSCSFHCLLSNREVHLWCLFPEDVDVSLLKAYESLLSPQELQEVYKAKTEKLQKERLLARVLVRTSLVRYAGECIHPSSLEFTKNNFGKPELLWPKYIEKRGQSLPSLCFNLSHTHSLLACAVANNSMVGIDVEESARTMRGKLMTLAHRKFSNSEACWLGSFGDEEKRRQNFLKLWTLKEAYVKALGRGISGSLLKECCFHLKESCLARQIIEHTTMLSCGSEAHLIQLELSDSADRLLQKLGVSSNTFSFLLFQPTPLHYASICVQNLPHSRGVSPLITHENWNFLFWKTVPLAWDETLKGAVALAITG